MSAACIKPRYNFKYRPPLKPEKVTIKHLPNVEWSKIKAPLFQWADNQAAKLGLIANVVHVFKTIIANTNDKGVTHITLESIRNKLVQKLGKSAPSMATIKRAISTLVSKKLIKRSEQKTFKSLITTRLLRFKSAMRSGSKRATEYISTHKDIYMRKGDTSKIAAFPSNGSKAGSSRKAVGSPALGAAAPTATQANTKEPEPELCKRVNTPEELALYRARFEALRQLTRK